MDELLQRYRAAYDEMANDRQVEALADAIQEATSHLASLQAGLAEYRQKYYPEIAALEAGIKAAATGPVEAYGVKVKYRKGYTLAIWDGKALAGFAAAHPEILPFRSEIRVAPSATITLLERPAQPTVEQPAACPATALAGEEA